MSTKRVPHIQSKRSCCHPSWSLAERITYYTSPEPLTGCHIWHGPLKRGYGRLQYLGRSWRAHRLALSLKHGPIPDGMILCHRCNVKRCVNPDHLALGTRADNNADTKAARLRLAEAREATQANPAFDCGAAAIRIFVGGVEMRGRVLIEAISPQVANDAETKAEPERAKRSGR
jgi:HNH endonuclease